MSVYRKLMQARIALQSRKLNKSGLNKFAGYSYFELGDFLPATMEIFSEVGLCGVISFGTDIATLTITDVETDKQITITSPMADAQLKGCHPIQNLGAVETYTRRYLWVTAMEIVEHDALDATTGKDKPVKIVHTPTQGAADAVSEDDKQYLQEMAVECIAMVAQGNPSGARERIEVDMLDTEQKTYLWTLLDSKTRSAIKAAKQ
jgi:hypothetical protein